MGNPKWRPYTVHNRLENLGLVNPHFAGLYEAGLLPVEIKESDAVFEDGEEVEGRPRTAPYEGTRMPRRGAVHDTCMQ